MQEVEIVGPATDTAQTVDVPLVICESDAPQLIAHLRTLSPHVTDDGGKTMCVWVPMKLLGRLCQTPVQPGAFYKLSDSKWAKAAPQPVVPTLGVVKHHDSLVLVHGSMCECTTSSHVLRVPPCTSLLGLLWTGGNVNVAICLDMNINCGMFLRARSVSMSELGSLRFSMVVSAQDGVHYNTFVYVGNVGHVHLDPKKTVVGINLVNDMAYWTELPVYSSVSCVQPSAEQLEQACSDLLVSKTIRRQPALATLPKHCTRKTGVVLPAPPPESQNNAFEWRQRPDPRDTADCVTLQVQP